MNEAIYSLWAILEKSFIMATVFFILWFFWIVPSDLRRARNTTVFAVVLMLLICTYQLGRQRHNLMEEKNVFRRHVGITSAELTKLNGRKIEISDTFVNLNARFDTLVQREKTIIEITLDRDQSESQISKLYTALVKEINVLEGELLGYHKSIDSLVFQCAEIESFKDSMGVMVDLIFRRLSKHNHYSFIKPSTYVEEIHNARKKIVKRSTSLLSDLRKIKDKLEVLESNAFELRSDLIGDIKILFISSASKIPT